MPAILSICAFSLGLTSTLTQILVLREFLSIFSGNELVIGVILGSWLLITGLGGLCALYLEQSRAPRASFALMLFLIAVLPSVTIVASRAFRTTLLPGLTIGLPQTFAACFLLLIPYCLVSGYMLAYLSALPGHRDEKQIGRVYLLDAAGGVAGGMLFGFALLHWFSPLQNTLLLFCCNIVLATAVFSKERFFDRARLLGLATVIVAVFFFSFFLKPVEYATIGYLFPGQKVIRQLQTPYGNIVVTKQNKQTDIYQNGLPAGSSDDRIAAEETVHYALSQHPQPQNVLLLSGGVTGAHKEALKYRLARLDYIEADPALIGIAAGLHPVSDDLRFHPHFGDARSFLHSTDLKFDAILIALPEPESIQLNRFYTLEFFRAAKNAMNPGGILSFGVSGGENYINPEAGLVAASLHRTLKAVFKEVLVIPGGRQFFIASDAPLTLNIAQRIKERGIQTVYVKESIIKANLSPDRLAAVKKVLEMPSGINRDFHPLSAYAHIKYWLSLSGTGLLLPASLMAALCVCAAVLCAASHNVAAATALSTSGFAGMGLGVIMILAFQIFFGYAYKELSIIITSFLAGCALGAAWSNRFKVDRRARVLQIDLTLSLFAFLLPVAFSGMQRIEPASARLWLPPLFVLLNGGCGFLVGAQFPAVSALLDDGRHGGHGMAGRIFAMDFIGSALGAIAVGAFAVPLIGASGTCVFVGAIKLISSAALAARIGRDRQASPIKLGSIAPFFTIVLFLSFGAALFYPQSSRFLYSLSLLPGYRWLALGLLGWGVLRALRLCAPQEKGGLGSLAHGILSAVNSSLYRPIVYLSLALAVFFPIFRCFFKVPYLFCHVCPQKCAFGLMRPFLVPGALAMNLENRHWCYHACPIGTLHDAQARLKPRIRNFPAAALLIGAGAVLFAALSYFFVIPNQREAALFSADWFSLLFAGDYSSSEMVLSAAALLFLGAFFVRRTFCSLLCPVGNLSQLLMRAGLFFERRLFKN